MLRRPLTSKTFVYILFLFLIFLKKLISKLMKSKISMLQFKNEKLKSPVLQIEIQLAHLFFQHHLNHFPRFSMAHASIQHPDKLTSDIDSSFL